MGKLVKKGRKQLPNPVVEDEKRRYQIRGEKTGKKGENKMGNSRTGQQTKLSGEKQEMGERIGWGTTATRPTMEDEWK